MEHLIIHYIRILDIDPYGHFIRLINKSFEQSINLNSINIRQYDTNNRIVNSFTFDKTIQTYLHHGQIVTIYSNSNNQMNLSEQTFQYLARHVSKWLIDHSIRTELWINEKQFDKYKYCFHTTNDIPFLFINRLNDSKENLQRQMSFHSSNIQQNFIFPYCLSIDNVVNPHIRSTNEKCFH